VKVQIFDEPFHKKMSNTGQFDAIDDQIIRIRIFFEKIRL
jgi:hypothetical protein